MRIRVITSVPLPNKVIKKWKSDVPKVPKQAEAKSFLSCTHKVFMLKLQFQS